MSPAEINKQDKKINKLQSHCQPTTPDETLCLRVVKANATG